MELNNGQKIGLVGSILAVVGIFLPWVSFLGKSVIGIQVGTFAYIALLLGILALVGSIMSEKKGAIILLVFGIIGLVWMLLSLAALINQLSSMGVDVSFGIGLLGIGYWLTMVGFFIAIVGGVVFLKELKETNLPEEPEY